MLHHTVIRAGGMISRPVPVFRRVEFDGSDAAKRRMVAGFPVGVLGSGTR